MSDSDDTARGQFTAGTRMLCDMSVTLLPVDGGAVSTRGGPDTAALLYATDPVIARLDDLEFVTGEGPGRESYSTHLPVVEPDLTSAKAAARWPWFTPEAAAAGAGAVFAFPLQVGAVVFGVLWFYRRASGGLIDRDFTAALGLAQTATAVVLTDIAQHSREHLDTHLMDTVFGWDVVNQALGLIAVQRHIGIGEARALLRSTAFAQNRTSHSVAADVLAHRVTL